VINKGETIAIVGPSGAGKSTLMDLLVRLYDPTHGNIKVDKIGLKDIKIDTWRNKIGYVSQDPFIFHATIDENISFAENKYSEEEIIAAARNANAHEFICEFPDGYQTVVGDKGMKLSGGQKQRITIARAIIRKPELIIFDEATSSLDTISENLVQKAIDEISKKYTVIIIAHRLSTIQNADRIIVLDNKRIAEEGKHSELLSFKGVYWALYNQATTNYNG
jgi:ABC-type multidrug transport system fused ATPase/permease subunit